MTYCPVCIKSSMTGATSGTGTAFPSRTTELVPDFVLVFVGLVLFKLLIYMSYVQRCRLRFLRKNDVLLAFGFMISLCYLYLFTCTVVQHHFHIRWYSCSITVTRGMPLVEKELFLQHLSSSPYLVGSVLLLRIQWGPCCSIIRCLCRVLQSIGCPLSFGHCIVCPFSIYGF